MINTIDEAKQQVKFFTDTGTNVTKRIENRLTKKFLDFNEAYAFAKAKRSYVYDLYAEVRGKRQSYGYAVPN